MSHDDIDLDDEHDPIITALRQIGESMLPPGFQHNLRTFDELMTDVNAILDATPPAARRCAAICTGRRKR